MKLQMTTDLTNIVKEVTGKKPHMVYNDKRQDFVRRYKFTGIYGVETSKVKSINKKISEKYPDFQFIVQNNKNSGIGSRAKFYNGLTVMVYDY